MPKARLTAEKFQPGQSVPATGIYSVRHRTHRPVHQAILVKGETFPHCIKCGNSVRFQLVKASPSMSDRART
ncbi:MAG TPA: hypothetical protein VHA33_19170 [Candidatus Angelobacter sp.]|nr:hypothetical protein [Candidatus Angelobacter sp.]